MILLSFLMLIKSNSKVLIVAAHPDDETLGCGGTIYKLIKSGADVSILILGEGVSSRFDEKDYHNENYVKATKIRNQGFLNALKVLGVKDYELHVNYCCQFDKLNILKLVKIIEKKIKEFKPDVLITHNPNEVNIDHVKTYEAVEIATRPYYGSNLKLILGMEIPCSGNWKFNSNFSPNFFVDIHKEWEMKLKAWDSFEGENREFPFPRSLEGLETMAKLRGMQSGLKLAEGFILLRSIHQ